MSLELFGSRHAHDLLPGLPQAPLAVAENAGGPCEVVDAEGGGETGRPVGRQHVVGAGEVVADRLAGSLAEKDRAGVADLAEPAPRVGDQQLDVLRGDAVDEARPCCQVGHGDDEAEGFEGRGDLPPPRQGGELFFRLGLNLARQRFGRGDADRGLEAAAVLGLRQQVGGDVAGIGALVRQHCDLGGAGDGVDADAAVDLLLGGYGPGAAGAGDLVDRGDGPGAEGEGGDRLGAADGVDLVESQHGRGGENHRVRQAAGAGRGDDADLLDAGHLRRHRGHQQRRQQRGLPSGDAEADPAQRQDPLAQDDAVPVLEEPGVAQLAAVKRADVRCRPGDRFLELRIHGRPCVVERLARNAEPPGGQGDAVELPGVRGDRGIPFGLDAAQDFGDRIDDLGGKPGLAVQDCGQLAGGGSAGVGAALDVEHQ